MKRHLVLVGLPGSGKSTVGRRVARLLDVAFTDIDETVVMAAGRSITQIFASDGEALFRTMEQAAMEGALAAPPHVISPGAGWISQPGNFDAAEGSYLMYLRVTADVAAGRLAGDATRPLLAGDDPAARLEALLGERESWYLRALTTLDGSGPPEVVAEAVLKAARGKAGW